MYNLYRGPRKTPAFCTEHRGSMYNLYRNRLDADLTENTLTLLVDKLLGFAQGKLLRLVPRAQGIGPHQLMHFYLAIDFLLDPRGQTETLRVLLRRRRDAEPFIGFRFRLRFRLGLAAPEKLG